MSELTKWAVERAGINFDQFLSSLKSAASLEATTMDFYSIAFTVMDDLELSNAILRVRAEHGKQRHRSGRDESGSFRSGSGFGDDRRSRRARVDRKPAHESGDQIRNADTDEIAIDVGRRIGRKRSRRGRGLDHHHDGDQKR